MQCYFRCVTLDWITLGKVTCFFKLEFSDNSNQNLKNSRRIPRSYAFGNKKSWCLLRDQMSSEILQNSGWKKADDRGIFFSSSIVKLYKNDIIMRRDKYFTIGKASKNSVQFNTPIIVFFPLCGSNFTHNGSNFFLKTPYLMHLYFHHFFWLHMPPRVCQNVF